MWVHASFLTLKVDFDYVRWRLFCKQYLRSLVIVSWCRVLCHVYVSFCFLISSACLVVSARTCHIFSLLFSFSLLGLFSTCLSCVSTLSPVSFWSPTLSPMTLTTSDDCDHHYGRWPWLLRVISSEILLWIVTDCQEPKFLSGKWCWVQLLCPGWHCLPSVEATVTLSRIFWH